MPVTPTYPGVYVVELPSPVHAIAGVATSIAAFVGYTARGIDNRAQHIFSFADYERLFGGLASASELGYAVQQFFLNGGTEAYVVRCPRAGAAAAQVVFGELTFTALSSGSWADGQLLIDIDYNGVDQTSDATAFHVTITNLLDGSIETFPNVSLDSSRKNYVAAVVNDPDNGSQLVKVEVGSPTPTTPPAVTGIVGAAVRIAAVSNSLGAGALAGTLDVNQGSADVTGTGTAFTTDVKVGQFLIFAADPAQTPYEVSAITDNTHLTLSSNYGGPSSAATGVLLPVTLAGTVALTQGSALVTGTGTAFTTALKVGQLLVFASDSTQTLYRVLSITDDTHLTLAVAYSGTAASATTAVVVSTTVTTNYGIHLSVSAPSTPPAPLPIDIRLFAKGVALPQTLSGLAAQVQAAINSALAVSMPGASIRCTVVTSGTGQGLRISALLPQNPDAVVTLAAPSASTGLADASSALGFGSPSSQNVAHYSLGTNHGGGIWQEQTSSAEGSDGTGLPGTNELVGDQAALTGIYALEKVDLFNLLSIPDATRASASDPSSLDSSVDPNTIYSAAIELCDRRRAFLLIDNPPDVGSVTSAVDWKSTGLAVHDANGAAFFPRLRLPDLAPDSLNMGQLRTFAPSGVVAGLYARIDSTRGVWKAPAGTEATLSGVQSMVYKLSDPENGVLNPLGLNCFRTFPVYGSVLWGARTLLGADAEANQWKYVPVRRVALYIEESLYRGLQWVVFEPNDEPLWASIRLNVGSFMQDLFRKGAFQGKTPADAYFVKCDSETTTQGDIDRGIVNILVGFAPLKPAEFVVIQIEQLAGQAQS